jgi:hypothetical protein
MTRVLGLQGEEDPEVADDGEIPPLKLRQLKGGETVYCVVPRSGVVENSSCEAGWSCTLEQFDRREGEELNEWVKRLEGLDQLALSPNERAIFNTMLSDARRQEKEARAPKGIQPDWANRQ